ncbi:hypothetical protein [Paenibacillus sp. FSL A5-0031]|uniref:hypothetical protein n=1 Tax=Paenibacillus sp. FSL A5-0031 TaxID=1920420 RepID=UPI0015C3B0E1|nr:hypothetical protein [Paenibacillus sp. FSL A5-0031]
MKTKALTRGAKKLPLSFLTLSPLAAAAYSNGTIFFSIRIVPAILQLKQLVSNFQ